MFSLKKQLTEIGVLGINRRNTEYTLKYNSRDRYPLVDDKLQTKELALKADIAVPQLYGVIATEYQVRRFAEVVEPYEDFALKPSRGSGGSGILVVVGRSKDMYRQVDGSLLTWQEVAYHLSNIISGMHSLGGQPDKALIEYRVHFDPLFEAISYQGVPDIRVIVFLGVPVMSMVRLPTRMSGGKANLHQGAIGAGIDLATGTTLTAVLRNSIVREHPDTGYPVSGVKIPHWEKLLKIAAQCNELTGLGYIGVDLVLDKERGPLILEMNARPGLNIQIANRAGLLPRLRLVEQHYKDLKHIESRLAFSRQHFVA
ncbi:MAG: alpha-L-glutamate ligase-like protein [Deltaproteobacteria bacterium]|jgi:alpha-L-glutamate ligase-like protein|nr:alpha-L-glutamate ligase-like protein [Deltaproteobacteria bacterium]